MAHVVASECRYDPFNFIFNKFNFDFYYGKYTIKAHLLKKTNNKRTLKIKELYH